MQNKIWTHEVLAQGWSGSLKVSRDEIDETFSVKMLTKFLFLKKIEDFPFTHYGQFLSSFVDNLACFTKKGLGVLIHFLCLEAVFFALKGARWLISLRNCLSQ